MKGLIESIIVAYLNAFKSIILALVLGIPVILLFIYHNPNSLWLYVLYPLVYGIIEEYIYVTYFSDNIDDDHWEGRI